MVEWSHTFSLKKDMFIATAYKGNKKQEYSGYPVKKIVAALKGIQKRVPASWSGRIQQPLDETEGRYGSLQKGLAKR